MHFYNTNATHNLLQVAEKVVGSTGYFSLPALQSVVMRGIDTTESAMSSYSGQTRKTAPSAQCHRNHGFSKENAAWPNDAPAHFVDVGALNRFPQNLKIHPLQARSVRRMKMARKPFLQNHVNSNKSGLSAEASEVKHI
jgi:hypothetical protein